MKSLIRMMVFALIVAVLALPAGFASANGNSNTTSASAADDEDQPHMQAALDALKQAEQHLNEAKHDKGGHRVAALKATREAIRHVEEGMKVADKK
jgi:F0F1-type ATP synthase epsilon subunit